MNAEATQAAGSARERILDAAERVVCEVGAARMTLDGVAQAAGVSKGGLLYHFRSKEALLDALAKRYVQGMEDCMRGPGNCAKTNDLNVCVQAVLCPQSRARLVGMGAGLLAAAVNDPTTLDVIRDHIDTSTRRFVESGCDFATTAVISLAIDGLMMRESLGISFFTAEQREQIVQVLLRIAEQAQPSSAGDQGLAG